MVWVVSATFARSDPAAALKVRLRIIEDHVREARSAFAWFSP
jgi:hypothetical protein